MEKLSLYYCYLVLSINYIDTYSQSYHSYHSHQVNNHPYHYIQPDSNNFLSNYIDVDYSENGFQCKNRCGTDGIFKGKNWCYTLESWDFCTAYYYESPQFTSPGPQNAVGSFFSNAGTSIKDFFSAASFQVRNFITERQTTNPALASASLGFGIAALTGILSVIVSAIVNAIIQALEPEPEVTTTVATTTTTTTAAPDTGTETAPTDAPEASTVFFREGRDFDGSKLFIDEIQIKSQCGIGNGVDSDIDLAFVLCQSNNCCSIEALPMVSADCNELDYFTNSQLGYCADFDFGYEQVTGHVTVSKSQSDEQENSRWAGEYINILLVDGNKFECQLRDITVQNDIISDFDCQYSGFQQLLI